MKILHLPLNVPGSEQIGQEKGFRALFEYESFDFLNIEGQYGKEEANRQLLARVADYRPDIVWAQIQETTTIVPQTWEKIRQIVPWMTMWSGDARSYVPTSLERIFPYFDVFYNDTDQKAMYKSKLGNCRYEFMPIAVDLDEATDYSHPIGNVPEVVFIGNHYAGVFSNSDFRYELMVALSRELKERFGVYGTGWPMSDVNILGTCPVKHQGAYYHKAKVVISIDHIQGILHWSERLIWALASGSEVIIQNQPYLKNYFKNRLNYFKTIPECVELCKKLVNQPKTNNQKNIDYVKLKHTWKQRAEQVLRDFMVMV